MSKKIFLSAVCPWVVAIVLFCPLCEQPGCFPPMALGARAAAADLGASQSAAESNRTILREAGLLAPDQPIASFRVPGDPAREEILSGDFYRLLIREYGQDILAQQLQDTLIRQEAARRGLVVSDADVEAKVALARSQLLQQGEAEGPRQTLEALLAQKNMTLDEFKQELRNQIALETMIRQDFRIPGDVILQDAAINKWVEDVRRRAALRGPREGLPPGIVAVVNGEEILEAGIVKELAERISRSELEKTLDETLNDRIIERLMKEKKIKIKDEDLDAATKRAEEALHKKPGMASITLESYLQAGGKTLNDLRQQFRHEIGLRKIVSAEITEAQLRAAFQFCQDAYNGKTVHALHILAAAVDLNTLEPLDPYAFERAKVKIENIWQQIRDGASFEDMARKESDDPGTAGKGGDLGFIKRLGDVVEEAAATAFLLRENEVSSPIRSRYGYHLVKVLEIRPGKPVTFEDVKQDVRANLVTATCGKWLDNYKQKLDITKNLGTMGRVEPISSRPRARPLKGQLRP